MKATFTGDVVTNHGLDTTNENRRLRTVLDVLLKREDTTAILCDLAWTEHGFSLTFCCPNGDDVELRLVAAVVDHLGEGVEHTLGLALQAARDVMSPATTARWRARIAELAASMEEG